MPASAAKACAAANPRPMQTSAPAEGYRKGIAHFVTWASRYGCIGYIHSAARAYSAFLRLRFSWAAGPRALRGSAGWCARGVLFRRRGRGRVPDAACPVRAGLPSFTFSPFSSSVTVVTAFLAARLAASSAAYSPELVGAVDLVGQEALENLEQVRSGVVQAEADRLEKQNQTNIRFMTHMVTFMLPCIWLPMPESFWLMP